MNYYKARSDPGQFQIPPGEGPKLITLFDTTFGTSLNQRHGKRAVQQILMEILNFEQGEKLPAVYASELAAFIFPNCPQKICYPLL